VRRLIVAQGSPVVSAVASAASSPVFLLDFLSVVAASGAASRPRLRARVASSLDFGRFVDILDASSK
jgi:hypothetical protein